MSNTKKFKVGQKWWPKRDRSYFYTITEIGVEYMTVHRSDMGYIAQLIYNFDGHWESDNAHNKGKFDASVSLYRLDKGVEFNLQLEEIILNEI